jgi:hypothetical protein
VVAQKNTAVMDARVILDLAKSLHPTLSTQVLLVKSQATQNVAVMVKELHAFTLLLATAAVSMDGGKLP